MRYSPSALSEFEQCPLKFRFGYIDGIRKKEENIEAFMGTCVHKALERMLILEKEYGREPGLELASELFRKAWDEKYHPGVVIHRSDLTAEDYRNRGLIMVRNYFEMEGACRFGELVELELKLNFYLGGRNIGGRVDRVQREGGTYHVIDYKTSRGMMSQESADADRQLAIYELGIREKYPDVDDVELHWIMLAHKEVATSRRSEEERRRLAGEVTALMEEIEGTTDFRPCESYLCGWCSYEEECAAEKERRTAKAVEVEPTAEELVEEYARLTALKAELNAEVNRAAKRMDELAPMIGAVCEECGAWTLEGASFLLDVASKSELNLPKIGTEQRQALTGIVAECGLWAELSDIKKNELVKALKSGLFGERTGDVEGALVLKESYKIGVRQKD